MEHGGITVPHSPTQDCQTVYVCPLILILMTFPQSSNLITSTALNNFQHVYATTKKITTAKDDDHDSGPARRFQNDRCQVCHIYFSPTEVLQAIDEYCTYKLSRKQYRNDQKRSKRPKTTTTTTTHCKCPAAPSKTHL